MTPQNTIHVDATSSEVSAFVAGDINMPSIEFDSDLDKAVGRAREYGVAYMLIKIVKDDDEDETEDETEDENEPDSEDPTPQGLRS